VTTRRPEAAKQEARAVLDALRRILRYARNAAARTHGSLGLSAAQLFVLQTLADADRSLSVNELAERTYADQSTVSVVAQRLALRGLVTRRRSSTDRRRVELSLSARGRALIAKYVVSPQAGILEGFRRLPAASRAGLAKYLPELMREMGLDSSPATMMFEDETRPAPRARRTRRRTETRVTG
jgi:DNA-binding MarR family transcriptional regulator